GTPLNDLAAALVGEKGIDKHLLDQPRNLELSQTTCASASDTSVGHNNHSVRVRSEFNLTLIGNTNLLHRLAAEISFVVHCVSAAWPEFKREPVLVLRRELGSLALSFRRVVLAPHVLAGVLTAMLVVLSAVLSIVLLGHSRSVIAATLPD